MTNFKTMNNPTEIAMLKARVANLEVFEEWADKEIKKLGKDISALVQILLKLFLVFPFHHQIT
jgi:hypothetical protein